MNLFFIVLIFSENLKSKIKHLNLYDLIKKNVLLYLFVPLFMWLNITDTIKDVE